MALINAVILPHSPLLIPEIGRTNYSFLAKTSESYNTVAEELKTNEIETILIISPHGLCQEKSYTLNVAPEMKIDLKNFGFIPLKTIFSGDSLLVDKIKNSLGSDFSLQLISENELDYGSAIPAYLLKNKVPNFKVFVLSPAVELSLEEHFQFGQKLQSILQTSDKKIAVISSSDLSHRLKKKSPGGYSPKGAKFDNKLIEYLADPETAAANILKMDSKLIEAAGECGLKPIVILLGILDGLKTESKILAYQTDFGVGYLSLNFKFTN